MATKYRRFNSPSRNSFSIPPKTQDLSPIRWPRILPFGELGFVNFNFNARSPNLQLGLVNHVCDELAKMSVVISHSLFCKLGESDSRLHSTLGHPHDAQIKNRVNINLGTIKKGVPEAASCEASENGKVARNLLGSC